MLKFFLKLSSKIKFNQKNDFSWFFFKSNLDNHQLNVVKQKLFSFRRLDLLNKIISDLRQTEQFDESLLDYLVFLRYFNVKFFRHFFKILFLKKKIWKNQPSLKDLLW